ncbi:CapA family protein [Deinococcus radiotolerans]|uniref:Capsule synthesis protein CapA domain-containing protein n=1 Tax=Deinococcus radiotolerans TaxID=1309407 RepID=A0ABQ2FMU3_9DEIO|nr:CapA family protein [Deinococcus radiotolerans]GGL09580.1 hypothetical protein GCM10010844_30330 [Deinococcus radiotolerans]
MTRQDTPLIFLGDVQCAALSVRSSLPAGFVVANLEAPLTHAAKRAEGKICLKANPAHVTLLRDLGVRAVSLANNHLLDYGEEGVDETLRTLSAAGIAHFGFGSAEDHYGNPLVVHAGGAAVGLLSYAHPSCRPLTQTGGRGIALYDPARVQADVARARALGCVSVVVCLHWGNEDCPVPTAQQVAVAREVYALGADHLIGHHSHIVQPRSGRTFFGLGNVHMAELNEPVIQGGAVSHVFRKIHMPWNTWSVVPILDLPGGQTRVWRSRLRGSELSFTPGGVMNVPPPLLAPLARAEPLVRRLYYWTRLARLFWQQPRLPNRAQLALVFGRSRP